LILATLFVALGAPSLLATDGDGAEVEQPAEETGDTTAVTTDIQPAVEVTAPPADEAATDWTYRYLIPTGIAIAILVILATSGQYFTNVVRKRYRMIEE
jgi:hypothetical protein